MEYKIKIMLVEDDPNLSMVLQDFLELMEYEVVLAHDGQEGLAYFKKFDADLIILDVMLPKLDGFSLATQMRAVRPFVPIIFLTAKSMKEDRLKGFQLGCDDYITKPFSTEELNLRIKAILRRCIKDSNRINAEQEEQYKIGKFVFDAKNMVIHSDFGDQTLTRKEAALLKLLCENTNKLLTREKAQQNIWGDSDYFIGRSMDVFIVKLRKYLKDDPNVTITNVHGTGFKLEINDTTSTP